jgi:hypothetical protein
MDRENPLKDSERSSLDSHPPSADVKNELRYISTPPICLYSLYIEKFTFYRGKNGRFWWVATV